MASTLQQGAKKSSSQHHAREGRWGSLKGSAPKIASSPKAQGLTSNKLGAEGRRGPHLLALTGTYSLLPLTVSEPRCRAGPGTGPGGHQKLGDSYLQPLQGSPAQAAEGVPSLPPSLFASIPSTRGTSHRFQELVRRRSPGHPRGVSRTPRGSYLGRDCRLAEEDRGRAGWRGGAAAYEAQGFRVGVPAGAALVRATVPSGDFGAAPASKRGGEGPGRPS